MGSRPRSPLRWGLGLQMALFTALGLWWWRREPGPPPVAPAAAPPALDAAAPTASAPPSAPPAPPHDAEADRARAQAAAIDASAAADPARVRQWQEEEPVALHAARDADRWRDVAGRLAATGQADLSIEARTIAMRLDRARVPVVAEEAQAVLVAEVDLLRRASFQARDSMGDPALLALLEDIQQGAHAALQHSAPPPVQVH